MVMGKRERIDKGTKGTMGQPGPEASDKSDDLSWSLFEILRQSARRARKGQVDSGQGQR